MYGSTAAELFYRTRSSNRSISCYVCSTAEVFYVTWSTHRSISTSLWNSSIKEGALIGVYLLCYVWLDCSGVHL